MGVLLIVIFVIDDNFFNVESNFEHNSIYYYKCIILVMFQLMVIYSTFKLNYRTNIQRDHFNKLTNLKCKI